MVRMERIAQQFLSALARDWDGPLGALKDHLDQSAREAGSTSLHQNR